MTDQEYRLVLLQVVRSASVESAEDGLCLLADAAWNKGWEPDLDGFDRDGFDLYERRKVAYLVDFFVMNAAMPAERSKRLRRRLSHLQAQLMAMPWQAEPFYKTETPPPTNRDALSRKWGLSAGFHPKKVKGLLDLQRRANRQAG
jgi:hypothetical protein